LKIFKNIFIFFFFSFYFTSCAYHLKQAQEIKSLNVHYIYGDNDGLLTKELIYQISSSGAFDYRTTNSDYILKVSIDNISNDQIGFRYDRHNDGTLKKFLMPTENRQKITASVSIISQKSDKVVFGPKTITADVDYDYVEQDSLKDLSFIDANSLRVPVLPFSVGQMESINSATEAALIPLYRILSQKIVDLLVFAKDKPLE
jgi:hypothetical protein